MLVPFLEIGYQEKNYYMLIQLWEPGCLKGQKKLEYDYIFCDILLDLVDVLLILL